MDQINNIEDFAAADRDQVAAYLADYPGCFVSTLNDSAGMNLTLECSVFGEEIGCFAGRIRGSCFHFDHRLVGR